MSCGAEVRGRKAGRRRIGTGAAVFAFAGFLALGAAAAGVVDRAPETQAPLAKPAATTRGPLRVLCEPDGNHVYVTESYAGTIAVLNAGTLELERRFESGAADPWGEALTPDGRVLAVTHPQSGVVAVLDLPAGTLRRRIPLRGMPWGIAALPGGRQAAVSLAQLDEVVVIDLDRGEVTRRIGVGRRPGALALTPDGSTLVCANQAGGSVSVVDVSGGKEAGRVPLGGVNVRGLALRPGAEAAWSVYATVQPPLNFRPASYTIDVWHNFVREVRLRGAESALGEEQWMDFGAVGSADQDDIVITPDGRSAFIAVSGRHTVAKIGIADATRQVIWPNSFREVVVGANPRGLGLSADGRQLWVANRLGNSVTVLDAGGMTPVKTIDLGPGGHTGAAVYGLFLFNSAHLGRDGRFSCNSCHPDGASDGLTWEFAHVPDGVPRRNTRDLRGGIVETPPYRWSGRDRDLGEFIQEEVTGLLQGPRLDPPEREALVEALKTFRLPANPLTQPDGSLTATARRGKAYFEGKGACVACHDGPRLGGTGKMAAVGTTRDGLVLDVPHLTGLIDSAPYLHDGRAASLGEIFSRWNDSRLHGRADALDPAELADLLEYLREQ